MDKTRDEYAMVSEVSDDKESTKKSTSGHDNSQVASSRRKRQEFSSGQGRE